MSLIRCVECGSEVSSYARVCPKCGCPMTIIKNATSSAYDVVVKAVDPKRGLWIEGFICKTRGVDGKESEAIVDSLPFTIIEGADKPTAEEIKNLIENEGATVEVVTSGSEEIRFTKEQLKETALYRKYQPLRCPRCGSTAVTTTSRGYSLLTGFIGSNKTVNRCGKCGHTWRP